MATRKFNLKVYIKETAILIPIVFALSLISNPFFTAHAQVVFPPTTTFPQTTFPQTTQVIPGQIQPFLPPVQTTFPPSVFPPTQSFLPPTSFAIPTGSLSPWFPSLPAITCGGTFTFTIVGDTSSGSGSSGSSGSTSKNSKDNGDNDSSDKDKHTI